MRFDSGGHLKANNFRSFRFSTRNSLDSTPCSRRYRRYGTKPSSSDAHSSTPPSPANSPNPTR